MKYSFFLTVLFIFICTCSKGQERIIDSNKRPEGYYPQSGDYLKDDRLNQYEGLYLWSMGSRKFILRLKKVKLKKQNINISVDYIIGSFSFESNDDVRIKEKKVGNIETLSIGESNNQVGGFMEKDNVLQLHIKDDLKNKTVKGILIKNDDGTFTLSISDIKKLYTDKKAKEGFTLPETMILTKQD